jgi:hypothetical protein
MTAWDRLWFAPVPAVRLGVARALVLGGLLLHYATSDFAAYATVAEAWREPIWFAVPVASAGWLRALHAVLLLALGLGAVGFHTRAATLVAFAAGTYLLAVEATYSRGHGAPPVVLSLAVLAASRAGDAFSVDARRRASPPPDGEYLWPLRAIQLVLATAFFAAGVAKLRHGGLEWITSDNLRLQLVERHYLVVPAARSLGLALAQMPVVCKVVAGTTVAIELLYPLALVAPRARAALVGASLCMLAGFAAFFGPRFWTFLVLSLAWVPWERVVGGRRQ